MAELSPQIFAAALVFVLGVRWLFGTPILRTERVVALFGLTGAAALASLITAYNPPQAPSYGALISLVAASSLPAFIAFVAGFGQHARNGRPCHVDLARKPLDMGPDFD